MASEMLYVLKQRLVSQGISDEKSNKVLNEIVQTTFSELTMKDIFCPQELPNDAAMKSLFQKLTHASIMKLNETSMGKVCTF
ncbi:unnamed protein product [Didymodactylos carnosus]|uniref:Uncharacterized protein n=1 Tax=Didymodactylos carnosus TaxID=1234261 RepID=A0A8S2DK31_9BILA|nr:unnamed protein product [Didymodactylos carnosus]CAF3761334.1 unnamed protein product [Didymodactylos carnosus]